MSSYSWTIGLQIVSLARHACLFFRDGILLGTSPVFSRDVFVEVEIADCLVWKVTNLIECMFHIHVVLSYVGINK